MAADFTQPDQLVIVVHGVGDPPPGETVNLLARSLAEPERPLLETMETLWLEEKSPSEDLVQNFPVHRRRLQIGDKQVEFCEAFWGDLSRVRRGWTGIFRGLFQILFGLRYVAYVAADQPGRAAFWLKSLGLISSRILHGPVLAVTAYLGILILAVCGTHVFWQDSYRTAIWTQIVILACSGVALIASQVGSALTHSRVIERFWFWLNATTAFVTGVMLVRLFWLDQHGWGLTDEVSVVHPGLLWYCRMLLLLLGMLWFLEIQVVVAMAVCWALALTSRRVDRQALHVAFLLPALAVGIWGQVLPMLWLGIKESAGVLTNLPAFSAVFDDAIPFLGVQMMMMVTVLTIVVIVVARYDRWRRRHPEADFRSGRRGPRLIVHGSIQIALGVCTAIGVSLVSALWLMNLMGNYQTYTQSWLGWLLAEANGYAIAVLVPIGGLLILALPNLRPGFDMILDVVNHFYFRPTGVDDVLDDDDEFDMSETTFNNGKLFFSRRDPLHYRVKRILSHYRDCYHHFPELLIVSHSQGTMVAIETLNDKDLVWLNNVFSRITLVTMGSPFHHLYQHYFGHMYPPLDRPFWASLRRRIDRWVNIFRVDDYVGTDIDFPRALEVAGFEGIDNPQHYGQLDGETLPAPDTATQSFGKPASYENHPVGPRGHQLYWCDREVLNILRRHLVDTGALACDEKPDGHHRAA